MVDLDRDHRAVGGEALGETVERRDVSVVVDAQLGGAVGAHRVVDVDVLHRDEAGAATGALLVVGDVLVGHLAVGVGEVRAHRRHDEAVLDRQRLDGEGTEQGGVVGHETLRLGAVRGVEPGPRPPGIARCRREPGLTST